MQGGVSWPGFNSRPRLYSRKYGNCSILVNCGPVCTSLGWLSKHSQNFPIQPILIIGNLSVQSSAVLTLYRFITYHLSSCNMAKHSQLFGVILLTDKLTDRQGKNVPSTVVVINEPTMEHLFTQQSEWMQFSGVFLYLYMNHNCFFLFHDTPPTSSNPAQNKNTCFHKSQTVTQFSGIFTAMIHFFFLWHPYDQNNPPKQWNTCLGSSILLYNS